MAFSWSALTEQSSKTLYSYLTELRTNADWLDNNRANRTYNATVDNNQYATHNPSAESTANSTVDATAHVPHHTTYCSTQCNPVDTSACVPVDASANASVDSGDCNPVLAGCNPEDSSQDLAVYSPYDGGAQNPRNQSVCASHCPAYYPANPSGNMGAFNSGALK